MRDMGIKENEISVVPVVKRPSQGGLNGQVVSASGRQSQGNATIAKKEERSLYYHFRLCVCWFFLCFARFHPF